MVDIKNLFPGARVKIIDEWVDGCKQNWRGEMDHWLGQIVTVRSTNGVYFTIEEDEGEILEQNGHWHWFPQSVDRIVNEEEERELPEINDAAAETILQFLFPGV